MNNSRIFLYFVLIIYWWSKTLFHWLWIIRVQFFHKTKRERNVVSCLYYPMFSTVQNESCDHACTKTIFRQMKKQRQKKTCFLQKGIFLGTWNISLYFFSMHISFVAFLFFFWVFTFNIISFRCSIGFFLISCTLMLSFCN